jgi:hypothetical protein
MITMKKMHEYSAAEWAQLFPEQRYLIKQAADDAAAGRGLMPVRAADGRGVIYVDPVRKKPVTAATPRRIGGLV